MLTCVNTLRPSQNGHRFADDTFKRIFVNENVGVSIIISLNFVPEGLINNIPALVQKMAWRRPVKMNTDHLWVTRMMRFISIHLPLGRLGCQSLTIAYIFMRQWIESASVQIMVCRLSGATLLSKPMLGFVSFSSLPQCVKPNRSWRVETCPWLNPAQSNGYNYLISFWSQWWFR